MSVNITALAVIRSPAGLHHSYVSTKAPDAPPLTPAPATPPTAVSPVVDLDTGGVIAMHVGIEEVVGLPPSTMTADIQAAFQSARQESLLPLVLGLPTRAVLGGSAALAPLHEAVRAAGRRPSEVIVTVRGGVAEEERRALLTALHGLRAIGYLTAVGDLGTAPLALDLLADAAPYLLVLAPELVERVSGDPRRAAVAESLVALSRGIGSHVLAPGITDEAQLAALRGWGVRLAQGPLLAPGPSGRVHVPLPLPPEAPLVGMLGPRVQELLLPAVTLQATATAEEAIDAFGGEPSITSVILVDEYQRPKGSLERSRFLLAVASRYGHALHARKPAMRLADPPRTVPKTTPAIAAIQVAGKDPARVYDDLVVTDEVGRCMGILRVSDLMRHVAELTTQVR
jgi:EAL domain-containing protein (putative c-di-GMP-specific phosphodiesterase class I)